MPIISGIVAGGVAIAGDMMSQSGQQATNAANAAENQENIQAAMDRQTQAEDFNEGQQENAQNFNAQEQQLSQQYNAQQADISRQFNAQQVAQQDQFQANQQLQSEQYNTQMSDTSMQRRVQDLQAAGINPLLAISEGGASTPTISPMSGAAATSPTASVGAASASPVTASPAGQGSSIPMQNTSAAFGNLGGQLNSALSTASAAANIDYVRAQTQNLQAKTGQELPAQIAYTKAITGLTDQEATQAYYKTQQVQEATYNQRLTNDQLKDIVMPGGQTNLRVLQATQQALISAQNSDATAKALGLQGLRNTNDLQSSQLGKILNYINAVLQPVGTAAAAAGKLMP